MESRMKDKEPGWLGLLILSLIFATVIGSPLWIAVILFWVRGMLV